MRFVEAEGVHDPRLNLAVEEHLLRNVQLDEPLLLFYVNEPAVIIGRNQNTLEEIDPDYVRANGIHVVRRLSGGGAVFHDLGNLNFSFITPGQEDLHHFERFIEPVVAVLRNMGVPAELRGKSDIFAAGKKVSGNAQYSTAGRMFSHGTLLFDSDLEMMLKALNPRQMVIESHAVQSIRNFVVNLSELLPPGTTMDDLREALVRGLAGGREPSRYELSADDWTQIEQLAVERYYLWDWNFGHSPRFNVHKSGDTSAGRIEVAVEVENGRVQQLHFAGNFAGLRDAAELADQLAGTTYDPEALAAALAKLDLGPYFGPLPPAELLKLLY
jgi:lipoate-protein ligase A